MTLDVYIYLRDLINTCYEYLQPIRKTGSEETTDVCGKEKANTSLIHEKWGRVIYKSDTNKGCSNDNVPSSFTYQMGQD